MKTFRRVLAVVLCLMMLCGAGVTNASALGGNCGKYGSNITWSVDGNTLKLRGSGEMKDYVNNGANKELAPWLDQYQGAIINIDIAEGITHIGSCAFAVLVNLRNCTIPSSVTSIGEKAFADNDSLFYMHVPNTVTYVGKDAFDDVCNVEYTGSLPHDDWGAMTVNGFVVNKLVYTDGTMSVLTASDIFISGDLVLPASVVKINEDAFSAHKGLTSVSFEAGSKLEEIGKRAFEDCEKIKTVSLPKTIKVLGPYAFYQCSKLEDINIDLTEEDWNENVTVGDFAIPTWANRNYHVHAFSDNWTHDPYTHWHACVCGARIATGDHSWKEQVVIFPSTYTEKGMHTVECDICKRADTQELPLLNLEIMPESLGNKKIPWGTTAFVEITINKNSLPVGAKVQINGSEITPEETPTQNKYTVYIPRGSVGKEGSVDIILGNRLLESAGFVVDYESGIFALIGSWFTNFLFNGFKWKDIVTTFTIG